MRIIDSPDDKPWLILSLQFSVSLLVEPRPFKAVGPGQYWYGEPILLRGGVPGTRESHKLAPGGVRLPPSHLINYAVDSTHGYAQLTLLVLYWNLSFFEYYRPEASTGSLLDVS
mgnify:FL=1